MDTLNRQYFRKQESNEANYQLQFWKQKSAQEKLSASWILTCRAYNSDPQKKHTIQRNIFSKRSRV